jgi:ATP-dependent RNA helicase DeaD
MSSFKDFALLPSVQQALDGMGFTQPTEIQEKAFPLLLRSSKVDFHGQAQTGTGKTLAFGIPLLGKIVEADRVPQALIIAPTRELVLQICDSLRQVAKHMNISIEPIYGGVSIEQQMRYLRQGVHIVVGTPGRLRDHLRRKTLSLSKLQTFILDEADIMLDMGFKEEIDEILECAPRDRQIWLFSATVKPGVMQIKKSHMKDPVSVRVSESHVATTNTQQLYCAAPIKYRLQALCRVIDTTPEFYGLIFCQTKILTGDIAEKLTKRGYRVGCLHGDMDQKLRNTVIKKFKDKQFDIVVATDVAARGIDVAGLTHVVNYSLPEDQESYVHRIGRTGRAGKQGIAITFINSREVSRLKRLGQKYKTEIEELKIPTVDDVLRVRLENALTYFKTMSSDESSAERKNQMAKLYTVVNAVDKENLVNGMVNLLADKYLKEYDNEEDIPAASFTERDRALQEGHKKELMFNVGLDDGIDREHVLQYCLDADVIENQHIERIRVIKRRSFVILESAHAIRLAEALRGKPLKGKRVQISLVDQQGEGRGDFGGDRETGRYGGRRLSGSEGRGGEGRGNFGRRRSSSSSWRSH